MVRTSLNDGWTVRAKSSIFAELQGAEDGRRPVVLPHDAQFESERGTGGEGGHNAYFPSGAFEYVRQLDVPEGWRGKRVAVEFEGVHRDAMVFVNGAWAAQRPNGYTAFRVDLDPYLQYGAVNTIRVDARAHRDSRWYSGAGIHRDVWLTVTEPVHLAASGAKITTPDIEHDRAIVAVSTVVVNDSMHTATVQLSTELHGPDGNRVAGGTEPVTIRSGRSATVRQRLLVHDPQLWGPDLPTLYTASSIVRDGATDLEARKTRFGIRRIQLDTERGLRINGETVKLRGACIHHDNGVLGAAAFGRAEERRVELLKDAGFNAVRSSHNPISTAMLEACDRVGMLVMDETFDMWTEGKSAYDYSTAFPEWWQRDLESMVEKDFNHPSVIFYSIGNEIPETGTPLGAELGRQLAETIRTLDPTRLVTNGINGFVSVLPDVVAMMRQRGDAESGAGGVNALMAGPEAFMNRISASELVSERTAESFSVLDVGGINYGEARYTNESELFPNRIVVGTETFPSAIDRNWALVTAHDNVIGDFTWTGWDYLGEVGIGRVRYADEAAAFEAPYPWITAWCGDLDITGHRRPQSYYREIVFGLRSTPYIAVARPEHADREALIGQWSWTDALPSWTWGVPDGTPIVVEVYSDAAEVALLVDGEPVGRAPAGPEHRYRAVFRTIYRRGQLEAVAHDVDGVETGRTALTTAGTPRLTTVVDRQDLVADHRDLAYVEIELRDEDGTPVTSVDTDVTVRVEGAGMLLAVGSGRPDTAERYDTGTHRTFDGRAIAVVRPTGPGTIRVVVAAPGFAESVVDLTAAAPEQTQTQEVGR